MRKTDENAVNTEPRGDVDDLIFCMEPDWLTSDR